MAELEYALDPHWSLKSEYLYSQFAGLTAPYVLPPGYNGTFSTGTIALHALRAGLNYRFGEPSNALALAPVAPTVIWRPGWTGFYAGVNGGYGVGTFTPSEADTFTVSYSSESSLDNTGWRLRAGGFLFGGQFGYSRELPNRFIAGVETDLQWSGIDARSCMSESEIEPGSAFYYASDLTVRQDWFGTTRLRLGYQPFDRAMIYATGGVAYAHFSANYSGSETGFTTQETVSGTSGGAAGATRIGWAAGAGAEYAITPELSLKTEYLYSEYSGFTFPDQANSSSSNPSGYAASRGYFDTGTLGVHLVRAGLNWKFSAVER